MITKELPYLRSEHPILRPISIEARFMATKRRIYSPNVRKRKAYATAFRVFISYFWLNIRSKLFGQAYFDKRINALHLKNADRIKLRVQELQGLFVKFGQLISNLSNILPEEFRAPLEELQDKIPPRPYKEIEQTIKTQLGDLPEVIFDDFHKEPLAAASIGQVHLAELDGEQVVVKIQHQNIDAIANADLTILENLVRLHAFFMNMQGLDHTYEQVRLMIEEELDYEREATSMQRIAENLKETPELRVNVPKVYPEYSTRKVLVSSFCAGTNIGHIQELKGWGLDLEDLAKRLVELFCKMLLVDGFYHADPHPGNILVNRAGEIILLDFGAVAHLSPRFKSALSELIEAVIRNDTETTVLALRKMGFLSSDKESVKFVEKLIGDFKDFLQDEVQFDGLNFQNIKLNSGLSSVTSLLKKVSIKEISNKIKIPKEYILLNRTIVLLVGNAFHLAPEFNAIDVVRPYLKKHILEEEGSITKLIMNTFKTQITTAISLPNEFAQFLKTAKDSELEEELKAVKKHLQSLHYLVQQALFCFLLFGLFYFLPQIQEGSWLHFYKGGIGVVSFLLLRSLWKSRGG